MTYKICAMYVHHIHVADFASTGMVANPVRGELNTENEISLSLFAPEQR